MGNLESCCGPRNTYSSDVVKLRRKLSKCGTKQLNNQFFFYMKCLGQGASGKVFKGINKRDSSFKVAIKILNKRCMSEGAHLDLIREVKIMKDFEHPNIVNYFETYDDVTYVYLVMELCEGGDLFSRAIEIDQKLSEEEASGYIKSLVIALKHIHGKGIMHRDIKP